MFAALGGVRPIQVNVVPRFLGQTPKPVEYGCPVGPAHPPGAAPTAQAFEVSYDPTLNCMRDARGNAICSDGGRYPPGCPHTPPDQYFTPGVTPDVTTGSRIEGQQPPPRAAGSAGAPAAAAAPAGGSSVLPVVAGVGAVGVIGAVAYFLFR